MLNDWIVSERFLYEPVVVVDGQVKARFEQVLTRLTCVVASLIS